jgi:hypothetical protein
LSRLHKQKIITLDKKHVLINDMTALRNLALTSDKP